MAPRTSLPRHELLVTALAVVVTGLAYLAAPLDHEAFAGAGGAARVVAVLGCVVVLAVLVARLVRAALTRARSFAVRLCALLTVVWVVVVFFAVAAYVAADGFVGLETKVDALYFSVSTLTTVGFGDITPVSQTARLLVVLQMVFDVVVVTTAVSLLATALPQTAPPAPAPAGDGPDGPPRGAAEG